MRHKALSDEKTQDWAQDSDAAACWKICAQDLIQKEPVFLRSYSTIQHAMEAFYKQRMSNLLVTAENPLDGSMSLLGRVSLKDVFDQIYLCLTQKDLINLNQVLHKSIENIMLHSIPTVSSKSDIMHVLSVLLTDFPYVIGVMDGGKLHGQICFTDLLTLFKPIDGKDSPWVRYIRQSDIGTTRVYGAMAKHIICLSPKDEIYKAMRILMTTNTFAIPILDDYGYLKRILCRMDILEYILKLFESKELTVFEQKGLILDRSIGALMEKEFAEVSADDSLADAVTKMVEKKSFCLAVTDQNRRFTGLLSFAEILNWIFNLRKSQA